MPSPNAIHRVLVTAFAAWMLFCCCEKRLFAALLFPDAVSSLSCCPDDGATGPSEAAIEDETPHCCRACTTTPPACDAGEGALTDGNDGGDPEPSRGHVPHGRCCESCCAKAPATAASFTLDRDDVGSELPSFLADSLLTGELHASSTAFDRSDGRPPPVWRTPRLRLVTTARLRI